MEMILRLLLSLTLCLYACKDNKLITDTSSEPAFGVSDTLATTRFEDSIFRSDTLSDEKIFIPWANLTEIDFSDECADFFSILETEWQRRPDMPHPYQRPCYRWSKNLETSLRSHTTCLQSLSRREVLQLFGPPTSISERKILYGTSETCFDDILASGKLTIEWTFKDSDNTEVEHVNIKTLKYFID